jgi:hypothetical protein
VGAGTPWLIVDLGCGRGEWLELLAARGSGAWRPTRNVATVAETRVAASTRAGGRARVSPRPAGRELWGQ